MKKNAFKEQGQALILIALAAVGLFAIVGLAIDGSAKFSDRRHAQNAADNAALTAALALVNDETSIVSGTVQTWQWKALQLADTNGYDRDLVTNHVWVGRCSDPRDDSTDFPLRYDAPVDCGPYEGRSNYVQVVIKSNVNTYFARVLGITQTSNLVNAVTYASKREPIARGDSIVALNPNPSCPGSFIVGGSATINLSGGGMFVNGSGDDCVWEQQGCNVAVNIIGTNWEGDPAAITSAGGSIDEDSCTEDKVNAAMSESGEPHDFPPEVPEEPDECIAPAGHWTNDPDFSVNGYTGLTILAPGRYNEFPPKSGGGNVVYDHVFMLPGIYCVNDSIKTVDKKLWLEGDDVTIYIRPGYKFSYEGGKIDLSASDDGPYAGYLMIVASTFEGAPEDCKINGNVENSFTGTIFAPYCNVDINGGSEETSYNAQIIAYEVSLSGNSAINFTYDPDVNRWNEPRVGLMR
ncbi:MAG TPA: Tad domain-containing protein [Anaerolineales bacterium]|nr:Tad domain-containing protein [Anaerolineales bacterium]